MKSCPFAALAALTFFYLLTPCFGYSVLTHEAIIDSTWNDAIRPLLSKRFPGASEAELREARAYAYGGCIIQDLGYYPFGNKFFTDLTHYVRTGDFILALIRESQDLDEYAFALGALAHYAADTNGHPLGINPAVSIVYPKLRARYGSYMTFEDSPNAHLKTEFGFDVLQVVHGNYAPQAYHDFIGFKVSKPVLERAFRDIYCIEAGDVFASMDLALGTYRRAVSRIIPEMTKVAWNIKGNEIAKSNPGIKAERFIYSLSRRDYDREWGARYEKPGPFAKVLSAIVRIIPKWGPFKALSFETPPPGAEELFAKSFVASVDFYRAHLRDLRNNTLPDKDFDTGKPTAPGEYRLCDETYEKLLLKLASRDFRNVSSPLRDDILSFYKRGGAGLVQGKHGKKNLKLMRALEQLMKLSQ